MNDYVHIEAADLCRPNARFTQERQGYQVLTPFEKLGYSPFFEVLQEALDDISDNSDPPSYLYAALVDMHAVEHADERLQAILTLNYDTLLEHAITQIDMT